MKTKEIEERKNEMRRVNIVKVKGERAIMTITLLLLLLIMLKRGQMKIFVIAK
jgi:hypothetical protein